MPTFLKKGHMLFGKRSYAFGKKLVTFGRMKKDIRYAVTKSGKMHSGCFGYSLSDKYFVRCDGDSEYYIVHLSANKKRQDEK